MCTSSRTKGLNYLTEQDGATVPFPFYEFLWKTPSGPGRIKKGLNTAREAKIPSFS